MVLRIGTSFIGVHRGIRYSIHIYQKGYGLQGEVYFLAEIGADYATVYKGTDLQKAQKNVIKRIERRDRA